jgi:type II secretory pathway pseudopilin PulG
MVIKSLKIQTHSHGYTLLILLFAVFVLIIGLLVAVPVWQTQIQREKEEELIFRGKQYAEAIRLFQLKKPGTFPKNMDELIEERCIRRLYTDPMTKDGEWNIILPYQRVSAKEKRSLQRVLVVPSSLLAGVDNVQIIGVVSASTQKSIRIYYEQESYDKWLFFFGQDPEKMPEIIYYGQEEKD